MFQCPGCKVAHGVTVQEAGSLYTSSPWGWNGSNTATTFEPSVLVHPHEAFAEDGSVVMTPRCHSFVRDGKIEFLGDCDHALKGQTVELPEWDQAAGGEGAR
jgi:hypothetical protein